MKENKTYEEFFAKFKEHDTDWLEHLTDSTYYDLKDFYAAETGQPFDDDNGYPDDVDNFASYIWKKYIQPPVSIIGKVFRKNLPGGVIHLLINTSHKWCEFETGRKVEERCMTICLSSNMASDVSFYNIPMGEGFNYYNYLCTSIQNKDQITLILVPRTMLMGHITHEIEPKEITED